MRHFIFCVFFLLLLNSLSASNPLKIGVISDVHYLSPRLMDNGGHLQNYIQTSGKNVKDVPAVLDKVLADYLNSDIEVLLVSGDITKDAERESHLDFADKLKPLKAKGVKVFVIPGNHDINVPNATRFENNKVIPVPAVSPKDFLDIYGEYGYADAMSRDTASLSYAAQLSDSVWLLAIDAARYNEYRGRSLSSGRIAPETEKWATDILDEARRKNIRVIGVMHWGLVEHIMYQATMFPDYLVNDWKRLANLFADKGMKAIFTGHFHASDITAFDSDKGNRIYDIETGTLVSYPFSYRFVDLTSSGMKVRTENVMSIPDKPNLWEEDMKRMETLAQERSVQKLKGMGYPLPERIVSRLSVALGSVFLMHAYGDERITDDLRALVEAFALTMDTSVDTSDFELDYYPADNNVEFNF